MAHVNQTYFKKGDSLSSSTYNSNIVNWNTLASTINSDNVRDQGLDVHSFSENASTKILQQLKLNPQFVILGQDLGRTFKLDGMTINNVTFDNDESYLYRCSINYQLFGDSENSTGALFNDELRLQVRFKWKRGVAGNAGIFNSGELTSRVVQITHDLYGVHSFSGDITVCVHLHRDRLNGFDLHEILTLTPDVTILNDGKLPDNPSVEITSYSASLTQFKGGA